MVERMASSSLYERAEHATRIIRSRISVEPRVAVVLGSGLGGFADDFDEAVAIPYEDIPGFVRSTAQGHAGRLVIGKVDRIPGPRDAGSSSLLRRLFARGSHLSDSYFQVAGHKDADVDKRRRWDQCAVNAGRVDGHQRSREPDGRESVAWDE